MAESTERKPPQKRLSKQNEIDDEEDGEDNSPSSDQSDTTLTAGPETPGIQSSPESPTQRDEPEEGEGDGTERDEECLDQQNKSHSYTNSKGNKLQRSQALTEDDSPPPDESAGGDGSTPKHKHVKSNRGKLEKTGSGSLSSEAGTSSSLSRDSSTDAPYTDSSGIDLEEFIKMTLNRTPKDRQMLLQLEKDLLNFIQDPDHRYLKFPPMSSYNRMLVHRIAAFFGLDHNVDQTGKAVIVNKTSNTRVPEFNFGEHIRGNGGCGPLEVPRRLLKRDGGKGGDKPHLNNDKRTKSLEERQYDYNQARARIFQQQDSDRSNTSNLSDQMDCLMGKRPDSLSGSKEDLRWREMRPWSSTDSSGYSTDSSFKGRQPMTKASSFGGVPSAIMTRPAFKGQCASITDSLSSGVSSLGSPMTRPPTIPSSPGNQSDASILSGSSSSGPVYSPPQPVIMGGSSTGAPPYYHGPGPGHTPGQQQVYWVASSADAVPPGSIIFNPQTGQPYLNQDGSVYRCQPGQPIPGSPSTPSDPPPPHPVYPQPTVIPVDRPPYSRDGSGGSRDLCQQMSSFSVSSTAPHGSDGSVMEAPSVPQHAPVIYQTPQPAQQNQHSQPVIMQQPSFYPSGQSSMGGQPVRYMYPVSYMSSGGMEGQHQPSSSISQPTAQFSSQPYVVPYSTAYQTVTYQPVPCQNSESYAPAYPQSVSYPTPPSESVQHFPSYTTNQSLYGSHPHPGFVPQQQTPQAQIFYTVPTSSPQPTTFAFRPTTPPSQGSVQLATNQNLPVTLTTPAPPSQPPGNSAIHNSPHYFQYPASSQLGAPRAHVPQIVPYPSFPQPNPGGQSVPLVRPNMQISMQIPAPGPSISGSMQQTMTSPAGHCAMKGFMSPETSREGGSGGLVVGLSSPARSFVRQMAPPAELRLYGQPIAAGIRPQIQTIQFQPRLPSPQSASSIPVSKPLRTNRRVTKVPSKEGVPVPTPAPADLPKGPHVLEVCDFPPGVTQAQADKLLEDVVSKGASISYHNRGKSPVTVTGTTPCSDLTVLAIFSPGANAAQTLQTYTSPHFTLRSTVATEPSITRPE